MINAQKTAAPRREESRLGRFAVLGSPIKHSLSPTLFKQFAQQTGQLLEYQAIQVEPENLSEKLKQLYEQGYQGVNLTAPLKEKALTLVQACSPEVRAAQAINVLSFQEDGSFYGDNTDGLGFIRDLTRNKKYPIQGKTILILGAGGAARGILKAVLDKQPSQVRVANRTQAKAQKLSEDFQSPNTPLTAIKWNEINQNTYDLIIQCTSAGFQGQDLALPSGILKPGACCYDLIYGPAALGFLNWAKSQGAASHHDGLGMLVEQAAQAYSIWFQIRVDTVPILSGSWCRRVSGEN